MLVQTLWQSNSTLCFKVKLGNEFIVNSICTVFRKAFTNETKKVFKLKNFASQIHNSVSRHT